MVQWLVWAENKERGKTKTNIDWHTEKKQACPSPIFTNQINHARDLIGGSPGGLSPGGLSPSWANELLPEREWWSPSKRCPVEVFSTGVCRRAKCEPLRKTHGAVAGSAVLDTDDVENTYTLYTRQLHALTNQTTAKLLLYTYDLHMYKVVETYL